MLSSILVETPGGPLWVAEIPDEIRQLASLLGHSLNTWKAPFIFAHNHPKMRQLWTRHHRLITVFAKESPQQIRPLKRLIRQAFSGKDRDILASIGYPRTDAWVRFMKKCGRDVFYYDSLTDLAQHWADPLARRWMYHLKTINRDVRDLIVAHPRDHVNFHLLEKAQMTPFGHNDVSWCLGMLEAEWRLWKADKAASTPWPYGKLQYEQIHATMEKIHLLRMEHVPFAKPPLEGTQTIHPITTAKDLYREAQRQRNCAFGMRTHVTDGKLYFYHLQRDACTCTVMLEKKRGYWAMAELRGVSNSPPSIEAAGEVVAWLRDSFPMVDPALLDARMAYEHEVEWEEDPLDTPELEEHETPGVIPPEAFDAF